MSYNLVESSNLYANTASGTGNVSLTASEIADVADLAGSVTLSGTDVLYLDCDLGARVKIDQVRYYFSSATASGTVVPTIKFYYKDDAPDSYSLLGTNIGVGYYYTSVPGLSAPRYVRMVQTISGTISGTVIGFSILNEDDTVDFGSDGTATSFAASSSVLGGAAEIRTIPVYNDGPVKATAYVTLEPQGTNVDELVTISTTSGGPWYGVKENAQVIADADSWSTEGVLSGTEIDTGLLQLQISGTVGTYTTKIFGNESKNSFVYLDIYSEPGDSFITSDTNKQVRTIEVRSTTDRPRDYAVARHFYYKSVEVFDVGKEYYKLYYKEWHRDDGTLVEESPGEGSKFQWNPNNESQARYAVYDPNTGKTAGYEFRSIYEWQTPEYDSTIRIFVLDDDDSYSYHELVYRDNNNDIGEDCYNMCWDGTGGIWASCYSDYAAGAFSQGTGYYLIRISPSLGSRTCTLRTTYQQAWAMSCVYSTGKLWITDTVTSQVRIIDTTGTTEAYYSATNPYGIAATSDGECWFINGYNLVHLDSSAAFVEQFEGVVTNTEAHLIMDGTDAVYVIDGNYVKRILLSNGSTDFSVYVDGATSFLPPAGDSGVWVWCSGSYSKFVSKTYQEIWASKDIDYPTASIEHTYDDAGHGQHFPILIDTNWQNLEWNEVRPDKYPLPIGDGYHQVRITLRPDSPTWQTPTLRNIYLQKSVEITDIYPGTAKNAYLKLEVPTADMSWAGSYNTNLKAWWEIAT